MERVGGFELMAVTGSGWTGVERSIAVTYTFERVLNEVGDAGSTAAARVLDVRMLGPVERALICSDSLGLLGGLEDSDIAATPLYNMAR
jgi:hypothetical protein